MGNHKARLCPSCGVRLPTGLYRLQVAPPEEREDAWHGIVGQYLLRHPEAVSVDQVLTAGLELPLSHGARVRVGRILSALGRKRVRRTFQGQFQGYEYVSPTAPAPLVPKPKRERAASAPPAPPAPRLAHRRVTEDALYEPVARWLLDLGDVAITVDEVLIGLHQPLTRVLQVRVGWILRALERVRVRRWLDNKRVYTYERKPRPVHVDEVQRAG